MFLDHVLKFQNSHSKNYIFYLCRLLFYSIILFYVDMVYNNRQIYLDNKNLFPLTHIDNKTFLSSFDDIHTNKITKQ
jgi:hypothetical protein